MRIQNRKEKAECLFLALIAVATDASPDASSADGTYEGTYDEDPEVGESCTTLEDSGSDRTSGVDAGAGVAYADEVHKHERETDSEACEVASTLLGIGGAEDDKDEDAGEDNLSQESAEDGDTLLQVVGTRAFDSGVGSEQPEQSGADESADDLENHVHASVLTRDALREEAAQGDSGVDVATADAADGVSHSDDCEAEGECCGCYACRLTTSDAGCYAATHEHENHRAYHFC